MLPRLGPSSRAAGRVALELDAGWPATTSVTRFELLDGARSARQVRVITELLLAMPCLPLDATAADKAAEVRRTLERGGEAIGMRDALIAGVVLAARALLLTRKCRHFERVPGLSLGALCS
ncbi:MAG: type II toxin-antitoxin system VapC family toxin [Acidobacteriota bacterium]|nr:MAG: type II toxin-antitoxin system VapC family toxin [Acidobacteriota bacterium]